MGFGTYDESEQETMSEDDDEDVEAVNVHENDHEGEVAVESDQSTTELVDQLQEIKDE